MKDILNLLPLIAFVILIVVLYSFLTQDNDQLESVLVDQSVPEFRLLISLLCLLHLNFLQQDIKLNHQMF